MVSPLTTPKWKFVGRVRHTQDMTPQSLASESHKMDSS